MFYKNYILSSVRLMSNKWWLSFIKIFSLTTGILSLLLIWFFYVDSNYLASNGFDPVGACSFDTLMLLGSILLTMMLIYFMIIRNQISLRYKEFFIRKYYGESSKGILLIIMIETIIFVSISLVLSLVFIDQLTPFFNFITSKNIDLQTSLDYSAIILVSCFFSVLCITLGILPATWNSRKLAVEFLKKLPS